MIAEHFLIARQLRGVPIDPTAIDALAEPGRSIARHLMGANGNGPEVFKAALDEFIPDTGKRQAFYRAVFAVDPDATTQDASPLALHTADEILSAEYGDPVWVVPDLLPSGLAILAGAPKLGKSWLALQIAQSAAAGGVVFGRRVVSGPILYLALEDNKRRLQKRMQKQNWPHGLPVEYMVLGEFAKQIGDLHKGGAEKLARQIESCGYRLVVIDTLSRAVGGDQNDAEAMTRGLTPLQEIAHAHDCAVLVIDHHRKGSGAFDSPNAISDILGSTAKGAMADTIWGLYRERGKAGAKLAITGREVEEATLALRMDRELGCWQCEGDAGEIELTERRQEILDALAELGRATLQQIATLIGQPKSNTYTRLQDLVNAGKVKRLDESGKVLYALP